MCGVYASVRGRRRRATRERVAATPRLGTRGSFVDGSRRRRAGGRVHAPRRGLDIIWSRRRRRRRQRSRALDAAIRACVWASDAPEFGQQQAAVAVAPCAEANATIRPRDRADAVCVTCRRDFCRDAPPRLLPRRAADRALTRAGRGRALRRWPSPRVGCRARAPVWSRRRHTCPPNIRSVRLLCGRTPRS